MKEYKIVVFSLVLGLLTKVLLNLPFMSLADSLGLYPFYGAIACTILGFFVSSSFALINVIVRHNISIKPTIKELLNILVGVGLMILTMFIMRMFIPLYIESRVLSVGIVAVYTLAGSLVYLLYMYKTKAIDRIFGKELINKLLRKIKKS